LFIQTIQWLISFFLQNVCGTSYAKIHKMKKVIHLLIFCFAVLYGSSQVAINNNGNNPAATSMLDVSSTTKGMLIPRMTSAQRKAISNPEMGLLVYDVDRQTIYLFDGVNWKPMMFTIDGNLPPISRQPDGLAYGSDFGSSVDIYGDYAVVGAPGDTVGNAICGAAYIYAKQNGSWKQMAKLTASNAVAGDKFGTSVSIYNDVVVIGAPEKTISGVWAKGRVYVFKRTGNVWSQVVGLQASNGQAYDLFGTSVAIDGQMIIAGAPYTDHTGKTDAGSAYIFRFENNNWIEKKILSPADATSYGFFGSSVDISGATVVIGAPNTTSSFVANVGAVYTYNSTDFTGTNWAFGQKLGPDDKQAQMQFGHSIDIEGDRLLVGAPSYNFSGNPGSGLAKGFKRTAGQWGSDLDLNSFTAGEQAGKAVAIDGDNSLFSYPGYSDNKGRVFIHKPGSPSKYVYDENKDANRYFGSVMAVHNGQYIIGTGSAANGAVFFGVVD
jgi:hypothetical protein